MAKQESAFDLKHIEETAAVQTSGFLDELNLPPVVTDFLRKNQRTIWLVVGVVAAVVTVVSLYGSYRNYTLNKAAQAYDLAMLLEGDAKVAALETVAQSHGSTPSALWSRVELAHIDQAEGKFADALSKLVELNNTLKEDDLLKPLVLMNIGGLKKKKKQFDKAVSTYQTLQTFKGFDKEAVNSMGRVYEALGDKEKAKEMFQQYLMLSSTESTTPQQNDPVKSMVQASLNRLQQ